MPKFKITVWEESVVTYQVEANDENAARDMINKNILRYEYMKINEEVKDWNIEDIEEIEITPPYPTCPPRQFIPGYDD